ncbi:hypothetical protein S83_067335, partial [Arachis hypogaea]
GPVPMEPASAINEVVVAVPGTDHQTSRDHYSVGAPSPRISLLHSGLMKNLKLVMFQEQKND